DRNHQNTHSDNKRDQRVSVIGSGPAGLACAQQLARAGYRVTVFEKADRIGGLLRYGIPDFRLDKRMVDRRLQQLEAEGVSFRTGVHVGVSLAVPELQQSSDAMVLACGSGQPREVVVPDRELRGIHYALDFLSQQNRRVAGDEIASASVIDARDKSVVVIGGGDTGSDCCGFNRRMAVGRSSRCPTSGSRCRPDLCCWRWGMPILCMRGCWSI
ncbi:MAG: hypothetical protein DIZ78_14295, partial [endosymbiont of Escarpia spicata]